MYVLANKKAMPEAPISSPNNSPQKPNLHILYYGLAIVGTTAVLLGIYNLLLMRWRSHENNRRNNMGGAADNNNNQSSLEQTNSSRISDLSLLSSFRYKKGGDNNINNDQECAVCLSAFEEGEEVRELPRCMHSFHVSCIDMWLYSHLDCPLCRSPVEPLVLRRNIFTMQEDNSPEGLLV